MRESVVTDLRDDVYGTLHAGHIAFSDLAIRDGGVELKIADAKDREQLARKLASAAERLPSRLISVTDRGDGAVRLTPADAASAARGTRRFAHSPRRTSAGPWPSCSTTR